MNIEKLFSSKERIKILNGVIFLEGEFGVNQIAKKTKLSKGLVSKYFEILVKENLLRRKKRKLLVYNNGDVKSIKILFNVQKVNPEIFEKYRFVKTVGLYGSCTKGMNTSSSDVDLWVKIEKISDEKIADLSSDLRENIENIKILILDNKKLEALKKEDPLFYHSLHFGSIILYGDENEI